MVAPRVNMPLLCEACAVAVLFTLANTCLDNKIWNRNLNRLLCFFKIRWNSELAKSVITPGEQEPIIRYHSNRLHPTTNLLCVFCASEQWHIPIFPLTSKSRTSAWVQIRILVYEEWDSETCANLLNLNLQLNFTETWCSAPSQFTMFVATSTPAHAIGI